MINKVVFAFVVVLIPFVTAGCFVELAEDDAPRNQIGQLAISSLGDNILRVSWVEPEDTSNIKGYILRITSDNGKVIERWVSVGSVEYSEAMEAGNYNVEVQTVMNEGTLSETVYSDSESVGISTAATAPDHPTNITILPTYNADTVDFLISWNQPGTSGTEHVGTASTVESYILFWKEGDTVSTASPNSKEVNAPATSTLLMGIPQNIQIAFILVAKHTGGVISGHQEAIIINTSISGKIDPVSDVTTSVEGNILTVSWIPPTDSTNIKSYILTLAFDNESNQSQEIVREISSPETSYSEGLVAGTYIVSVQSKSTEGMLSTPTEPLSGPVTIDTLASPPTAVSNIIKLPGNTAQQLSIQWDAAIEGTLDNGSPTPTLYRVYYAPADAGNTVAGVIASNEATIMPVATTTFTIDALLGASGYDIVIQAINQEIQSLFTNSEKITLISDGVQSVSIQLDGSDAGTIVSTGLNSDRITFTASAIVVGVNDAIIWESDTPIVATIAPNGYVIYQNMGSTIITARANADSAVYDSVILTVTEKDISIYRITYEESPSARITEVKIFDTQINSIPSDASSVYSIVDSATQTSVSGISIDPSTASITVDATMLSPGTYDLNVIALPGVTDYVGSISIPVSISIAPDLLAYKSAAPTPAQAYFTIGDVYNPYLYEVSGLSDASNATADVEIVRLLSGSIMYQQTSIPLLTENGNVYFGLQTMNYVNISGVLDGENIQIQVTVRNNGNIYDYENLVVAKNESNIYTWHDLQGMQHNPAGDYIMLEDITFPTPGTQSFPLAGFTPVGNDTDYLTDGFQGTAFTGSLNGNNKTITDFYINNDSMVYAGLFGRIMKSGASLVAVKDLSFINPQVTALAGAGVIAGDLQQGTITGVGVDGVSSSVKTSGASALYNVPLGGKGDTGAYTGGLVGAVGFAGILSGYSAADVENTDGIYVGGLTGYSNGVVTGYVTGTVTGKYGVGGLMGHGDVNSDTVGYMTGNVNGTQSIGGLAGYLFGKLTGFNTGDVFANNEIGGIAGVANIAVVTAYSTGNVIDTSSQSDYIAGLGNGTASAGGGNITGYFLGYLVFLSDSGACSIGFIEYFSTLYTKITYGGRTASEELAGGDHMPTCSEIYASSGYITEALSASTGSRAAASFAGFTFGTAAGEWTAASDSTTHSWPILNFPADFPGGPPVQDPKIGTAPEGFID